MVSVPHRIGLVDEATMRKFHARCLTQALPITPKEIKAPRGRG
jgi:DNA-binding transcriptional regulator YiaG